MLVWCNANTQVGVLLLFRSLRCASRGLSAVRVVGPVGEVHFSGRAFYFAKKKPQTGGLGARCLRCVLYAVAFATVFALDECSDSGVLLGCPTSQSKCLGLVCRTCSVTR